MSIIRSYVMTSSQLAWLERCLGISEVRVQILASLSFVSLFFHNYIIYWSKHVSCTFSCDDLLCIYSKSLLLVCNPNHYFRCLTLTWPLTWHCDSFTHLAYKTSFLCILIIFILPTFSHLFFRNKRQLHVCKF